MAESKLAIFLLGCQDEAQYQHVLRIRHEVFVDEQKVDPAAEVDGAFQDASYFLGLIAGEAVATGRLRLTDGVGKIERMATVKKWRNSGIGSALLALMKVHYKFSLSSVPLVLHAQARAVPFYSRQGFTSLGVPFVEQGIEHELMALAEHLSSHPARLESYKVRLQSKLQDSQIMR